MVKRASVLKCPAAVLSPKQQTAQILGGDNFNEGEFCRLKRSLRRANKLDQCTQHVLTYRSSSHPSAVGCARHDDTFECNVSVKT